MAYFAPEYTGETVPAPNCASTGPWSETVLYTFFGYPVDACYPQADLAFDTQRSLSAPKRSPDGARRIPFY
jgi:hypothetical protein